MRTPSCAPVVPLRITVGDEFQGCFGTVGEALHAALWLRLHLAPDAELRHGVGWGSVAVLADSPRIEDGPGWWAARAAIESVKLEAARPATRQLRTAYRRAEETDGPDPAAVNAALMCRDQMIGSVSERSLRLLRGHARGQDPGRAGRGRGDLRLGGLAAGAQRRAGRDRRDRRAVEEGASELDRRTADRGGRHRPRSLDQADPARQRVHRRGRGGVGGTGRRADRARPTSSRSR